MTDHDHPPTTRPTPTGGAAPAVRIADAAGRYRRAIRLVATGADVVEGALEDDFHHFEVTLQHDGHRVRTIEARSRRWPWTTCPDAGAQLRLLDGMALSERCTAVAEVADPRRQCTHQFDLAGLAVAHAARGIERRDYEVELPPADGEGVCRPRLWRDGALVEQWTLVDRRLVEPTALTAAPWRGGFIKWADANLEPEVAERAIVLRRACDIGMGRGMDLEAISCAEELAGIMQGVCYTMQPEIMPVALRQLGTIRDFSEHRDALLGEP
jgi:hypothetical protein